MKRKFALKRRKSLREGTIDRLLAMSKSKRNALIYGTREEPRRNGMRVTKNRFSATSGEYFGPEKPFKKDGKAFPGLQFEHRSRSAKGSPKVGIGSTFTSRKAAKRQRLGARFKFAGPVNKIMQGKKIPIVFGSTFERRKGLRAFTPKRAKLNLEYERVVREWQRHRQRLDGFQCQFVYANGRRCQKKCIGRRPHHKKGRGKYLCDVSTFLALDCPLRHHSWVHDHPKEAEKRGLLVREYAKH